MGKSNANAHGKRNSTEGAVLVRIKPKKIIAHGNDSNDVASLNIQKFI